ncbi:adenylate kinase [Haloferax sp. Atlit-12N]|uniref:adenylate kinase family protein n=1 Tax=Haloferax sp. Atlit-12N TaxID=2077203 RepID=UPI000E21D519|nr:adenylate kinase family protein [Haloferax sp. Atlit-12N]RDZ64965.1 adenylate kinase [Haloferax sp. Atlit-12N]
MRVVVTGTPGTGKTTATERVADDLDLDVVHLNRLVKDEGLWTERDEERDTLVVDLDAARDELGDWDGIVESHLAHHFEADRVVVLRCRPDILEQRLLDRGEAETKARENRESEALDVILGEAVEFHGEESVYEIDTTERDPDAVADDIAAVVTGEREPSAGTVDFIDYL